METRLTPEQRQSLARLARSSADRHVRRRATLLLAYADGKTSREVAEEVGLSMSRVQYWRRMFLRKGMAIFPATSSPPPQARKPAGVEGPVPAAVNETAGGGRGPRKSLNHHAAESRADVLKMMNKIVRKAREVLRRKAGARLKKVKSGKGFEKVVSVLGKERKRLRRALKKETGKKKREGLRRQLKALEKQLDRAEALVAALEKDTRQ